MLFTVSSNISLLTLLLWVTITAYAFIYHAWSRCQTGRHEEGYVTTGRLRVLYAEANRWRKWRMRWQSDTWSDKQLDLSRRQRTDRLRRSIIDMVWDDDDDVMLICCTIGSTYHSACHITLCVLGNIRAFTGRPDNRWKGNGRAIIDTDTTGGKWMRIRQSKRKIVVSPSKARTRDYKMFHGLAYG